MVAAALVIACGGQPPSTGGSSNTITGTERMGWDQTAADASELASFTYAVYVDGGARTPLSDASCSTTPAAAGFACVAALPALSRGAHTLQLVALRVVDGEEFESSRSSPALSVTVVTATATEIPARPLAAANGGAAPLGTFATQDGVRLAVQTFATGLDLPVAMAFAPDGRLFIAERNVRIRVMGTPNAGASSALELADALDRGEAGAFADIALHPAFTQNHSAYVLVSARRAAGGPAAYRLLRYREVNGGFGERAVLLDGIPAGSNSMARLRFGADGRLYMAIDDVSPSAAQDLASYSGKVLRLQDDGTTPRDNPLPSPVYASGLATPRGLSWHPVTGDLWLSEQRPDGRDALHLVTPRGNYGWPDDQAPVSGVRLPLDGQAPSGASFYSGQLIRELRNDLFVASLNSRSLMRFRFDPNDRRTVVGMEHLLQGRFGRLGDVGVGSDGALYVSTANRSTPTEAQADDDRILRIGPVSN
jgi:quinoprotein glucose dehydrogenase